MTVERVRAHELIRWARARAATDLHFGGSVAPAMRIDGRLILVDAPAPSDAAVRAFLAGLLSPAQLAQLDERGTADAAVPRSAECGPYRIHAYRHLDGLKVALRLLAQNVPSLEALGMPDVVASLAHRPSGLVLFTGPTGSGKTTVLASLIDCINRELPRNVVTIEDPVEYVHSPIRSLVTHREIGRDADDFGDAVRSVLRADPDVILIGEMRDRATIAAALTAAETGHLVFSTLHTNDAAQTIDRIVDAFPAEAHAQARLQLSAVLNGIVALRLVPRASRTGRCAAAEILIGTDAVRALVREGKTHQIRNAIVTGRSSGMQTLETHLSDLILQGQITLEQARTAAHRPAEIRALEGTP